MSQSEEMELSPKKGNSKPSWVAPSFGFDLSESSLLKRLPAKRPRRCPNDKSSTSMLARTVVRNASVLSSHNLNNKLAWVDKYAPHTRSELAVHAKKIDDVYAWLDFALKQSKKAPILVLSGPPGAGKTATLKVAAKEMNFLLREWITPINNNLVTEDLDGHMTFDSNYRSEFSLVKDFLFRASRYPSVLIGEEKIQHSVVLMEDLPLTFLRNPECFHELLCEYAEIGRSPLVIIIGDNKIYRKLITESIISQLDIKIIEFNPVAMTIVTKLLQSITKKEAQNILYQTFQSPPEAVISSIYESCCGDLRSAINTLQFACLKGGSNTTKAVTGKIQCSPKKSSSKRAKITRNKKKGTELAAIGGRDAPDDFFRAIGRVLYAKRDTENTSQHERGALVHNPQDIVSSYAGSAELFTGFLHENYLQHFGNSLEAVTKAADYLSSTDLIMNPDVMDARDTSKTLGFSVAIQGIMYTHPGKSSGMGFKAHHKSRSVAADKSYNERRERAQQLFPNSHCSSYELLTELVPYIAIIGPRSYHTDAQLKFIENSVLDRFSAPPFRTMSQTKSVQTIGSELPNALRSSSPVQEDDTLLIEEFPDSD